MIKTGNSYSIYFNRNALPSLGYYLCLRQLFSYCYVPHSKDWQTPSAQLHPTCSDSYTSHPVLTAPWLHTCPFLGLYQRTFFLLTAGGNLWWRLLPFDHIIPPGILLAFTSVNFIFLCHCQSDFAHSTVFSITWDRDFQFPPDQSIISAFDSDKPSLKQMLSIAFPLLTLRLCEHSLTVLPQTPLCSDAKADHI